ncbi:MAG TPA: formyltransferase family protein [Verrucomicrobiae bacterium]|nr:formyltransferase family protein [Verrucomicrobiae bacterium]
MSLALYLMTERGHAVLRSVMARVGPEAIRMVIGSRDSQVQKDYYEELQVACGIAGVPFYDRQNAPVPDAKYALAVAWRWLIRGVENLITLHDSLLPRYRGFAPVVNALLNGEQEIGVTALYATDEYDTGDIIRQERVAIEYPIKIQQAIERITPLYAEIAGGIASAIVDGKPLPRSKQDESQASYSPWRDDSDYQIPWTSDAARIRRFIDAVGYPYLGARTLLNGKTAIIHDAVEEADVRIEDRAAGKVIFERDGMPVVVCGSGLLRITRMTTVDGADLLPLKRFRSRFR